MTSIEEEIRKGDYTVGLNGVAVIANTFADDMRIAEKFGEVEEFMERAFAEWKEDIRYITALAITANHAGWYWWGKDGELAKKYFRWWEKLDAFILDGEDEDGDIKYKNFKSEEVSYFIQACD